jgi:hypothetical protein
LSDRYGRVHESESSRAEIGPSGFTVLADGFGLYLFIERQPRPRGMSLSPAICVAEFPQRARFRQSESHRLTSFQSFGLAAPIARALVEENYLVPTPIQAQTVPLALTGRDIIGIAQTGTGKTAAFALPILHHLFTKRMPAERKSCRVLVLSPTRELSSQILDSFRAYGRHVGVTSALVIGGVPMGKQVRAVLNGVDVLVATPGRLLDLAGQRAIATPALTFWCSTKPIACSTWASLLTSARSWRNCRRSGRRFSFPPPCRRR